MLPIYNDSYRPSSNWAKALERKLESLRKLEPFSDSLRDKIQEHLLVEQVVQNLALGDINLSAERLRDLFGGAPENGQTSERAAISFANAVRYLNTFVESREQEAQPRLTSDLLRELHALAMEGLGEGGGFYRATKGKPIAGSHQPADAEALPFLIDNALDWFAADSFLDLHPVEQSWLVHLRLMDLQPFAEANGRIARLAASLYTMRAGLGPVIVSANDREFYNLALVNSFQMITQPGIELAARSVMRVLDEQIAIAGAENPSSGE